MKTNIIAFAGISILVLFVVGFASIFEIRLASAQVDATSSALSTDSTTTLPAIQASTSPTLIEDAASSTLARTPGNDATNTTANSSHDAAPDISLKDTPTEPPPQGLTLVHIVGTKYTDYFTDGKAVTAFPGDPAIDSNFDKPDAPIPTHDGMTWVHSTGAYLYDTPSGDLEVGDYAVQPDNSYIENAPPFVSSTSTPAQLTTSAATGAEATISSATSSPVSPSVPDGSTPTTPAGVGTDASSSSSL